MQRRITTGNTQFSTRAALGATFLIAATLGASMPTQQAHARGAAADMSSYETAIANSVQKLSKKGEFSGITLRFATRHLPPMDFVVSHIKQFQDWTGATVQVTEYGENPLRDKIVADASSHAGQFDLYNLDGNYTPLFASNGWIQPLGSLAPSYRADDILPFSRGLYTYKGQLYGAPIYLETTILYYRKDLFQKCGVALPASLPELEGVAAKLKVCDANVTPFVSRGLKPALPFSYSVFLHNMGGDYMKGGKSQLCSKEGQASLGLYAKLLKDYGPPGVVNYSFYQISGLYREGKAAMAFESSNELSSVMQGDARLKDTSIAVLPAGPGGSRPTVIGWTMSVSAHSKKKEAAWYFVQWATSKAVQEKLALDGVAPPRAAVANGPDYKRWIDEQPVRREWANAVTELGKTGISEVGYPITANPASREFVGQAVDEVILGQKTVAEACADADKQLDALIAKE